MAPHLGLGYLTAALRRDGHQVTLVDGLREKIEYDPNHFDLVGVTAMSTSFPEAVREVKRAKAYGLKVVIGGAHIIATPESSLRQSGADYAVTGEGEIPMTKLANGVPISKINGLAYLNGSKFHRNPPQEFIGEIDHFDRPAWDVIDPRTYPYAPHGMIARRFPLAPIITTRGCPYLCTYCSAPMTAGPKMRYRNPELVVDEIEMLVQKYDVREVQIEDDNFTFSKSHAMAICEGLIHRNVKVIWSLPNGVRIDRLDPELLAMMKRSGCYLLSLGIESANKRILKMVKKGLNLDIVRAKVREVVESGIDAVGFFMIGFPTETHEEIQNTIDFALSLPLHRVYFSKTTPLPGTPLYDLWREKYMSGQEIDWSRFNYYEFQTNWSEVPPTEIARLQRRAHWTFYSRPKNFWSLFRDVRLSQLAVLFKRYINHGFGGLRLGQKATP